MIDISRKNGMSLPDIVLLGCYGILYGAVTHRIVAHIVNSYIEQIINPDPDCVYDLNTLPFSNEIKFLSKTKHIKLSFVLDKATVLWCIGGYTTQDDLIRKARFEDLLEYIKTHPIVDIQRIKIVSIGLKSCFITDPSPE